MTGEDDRAELTPELLTDLYENRIKPFIFGSSDPAPSPRLVLVGGQPGAGKSYAISQIRRHDRSLVALTGDALRQFHPDYAALLKTDPLGMPNATAPAVADWVRRCIDHALTARLSLLLEGTFRDIDVVSATIRRFAERGYHTAVEVLAVRPERSRLNCLLRYLAAAPEAAARWTPPTAHDTSFARLPDTVRALQDVDDLHRIVVRTRTGATFTDERGPDGRWTQPRRAVDALTTEHSRPLDAAEADAWLRQYEHVIATAEQSKPIDVRALPAYAALIDDANRVAAMARDHDRAGFAGVQRRAVALVAAPPPRNSVIKAFSQPASVDPHRPSDDRSLPAPALRQDTTKRRGR